MGEIYLARDTSLGREVAIKFLPVRFASDPERTARFENEARAASSLNHPNIVTVHEFGSFEGVPFLVMEYVQGRNLRQVLESGKPPYDRIIHFAAQIADGLAKAHAAGVVHRDLKPENLMITQEGLVKILDFGLAKLYGTDAASLKSGNPDVATLSAAPVLPTANGIILGTIGYMSPEQASGRPADFRSDQFAFGAILYEMVTGHRAFRRDTPVQTLSAIIEEEPEPVQKLHPSLPTRVCRIVERCLAKDPNDRYASTAEIAEELNGLRNNLQATQVESFPGAKWRIRSRRWLGRFVLVLALAIGLLMFTPVREGILGALHLLPIPNEKRIAVLPFRYLGTSDDDRMLCDGLLSYLTARLGQIQRFEKTAWVVPVTEVREAGVISAATAGRALGVSLAIEGSLQRVDGSLVLTASLIDTTRLKQLRATTLQIPASKVSLLEEAVNAIIPMLDLELGPQAKSIFQAGGSSVVQASMAYGKALGHFPYQQARNALERYEQEQNLEQAISLFNEALAQDSNYALAHAGISEAYWRISRYTHKSEQIRLAIDHSQRALTLDSTLAEPWITLGMIHAGSGQPEKAVQELQRAIDRNPRNAAAYREQARAFSRLNDETNAEATYRKAIALDPESWVTRSYFGTYLANLGHPTEAEKQYKEALKRVPDNARIWAGLGSAYYLQQRYKEAEDAWQRSLALYPTAVVASNLALRPFFEGSYAEAARRFEAAVRIDNRDYRVWRNLADAYYWSPGGRQRAEEAYRQASVLAEKERILDPSDPRVWNDLAVCYVSLKETAKAREALAQAERLGGGQGEIARTIAAVHEELGERSLALKWILTALKLGVPGEEIENDPGLQKLRADERYQKIRTETQKSRTPLHN